MSLKDWTVLAYLVADHSTAAVQDPHLLIDEVAQTEVDHLISDADLDRINVAVQVDFTHQPGVLRVIATGGKPPVRVQLPESDAAAVRTIEHFIEAVREQAPARHYLMLLWGHGAGPIGFFSDRQAGAARMQAADTLTMAELKRVLVHASGKRGFGKAIDLLLIKSCCVGSVEAVWELRDHVDLMICSQAKVPIRAWRYSDLFKALKGDGDVRAIGRAVLSALSKEFDTPTERNNRGEVPYTLLAPGEIRRLREPLSRLSQAIGPEGARSPEVRRAIDAARNADEADPALVDIAKLALGLERIPALAEAARSLLDTMRRGDGGPVVAHVPYVSAFSGLSLFHFPPAATRSRSFFADGVTSYDYDPLDACRATGWHAVAFSEDPLLDSRATVQLKGRTDGG